MIARQDRQDIIRDFAVRHDGRYHPARFVDEVSKKGEKHPAYEWFEWDDGIAAQHHRVHQARMFAINLKVRFEIEDVKSGNVKVRSMPFIISPVDTRCEGGNYFVTDPNNPDHMQEFCRQAADDLGRWFNRYEASLAHVGASSGWVEKTLKRLRSVEKAETAE